MKRICSIRRKYYNNNNNNLAFCPKQVRVG
jgi:hypothetical protein